MGLHFILIEDDSPGTHSLRHRKRPAKFSIALLFLIGHAKIIDLITLCSHQLEMVIENAFKLKNPDLTTHII